MSGLLERRLDSGELPGVDGLYDDERFILGQLLEDIERDGHKPRYMEIDGWEVEILAEAVRAVGRLRCRRIEDLCREVRGVA